MQPSAGLRSVDAWMVAEHVRPRVEGQMDQQNDETGDHWKDKKPIKSIHSMPGNICAIVGDSLRLCWALDACHDAPPLGDMPRGDKLCAAVALCYNY